LTPHNLGFLVIDRLAETAGARVTRAEAMSLVGLGRLAGEPVLLAKPQTYMNASGMAVRVLLEKRNETPASLLVIADDVALPWGLIRLRERGGSGGHNGLESIIGAVGTEEFCRVRVGIKPDHAVEDLAEYVLTPMRQAELAIAAEAVDRVAVAVTTILKEGIERAMARFNRKVSPEKEEPAPPVAGPGEGDGESRRT
jgi:PTH1 family peptidyl-tRNA hydrolase